MGTRLEQIKEHLLAIFNTVDTDHNGKIDKKEAKALMDKMQASAGDFDVEAPAGMLDEIFKGLDIDNSGGVDFDECFLAFRQAFPEDLEGFFDDMHIAEFVETLNRMEKCIVCIETGDFGALGADPSIASPGPDYKVRHKYFSLNLYAAVS